MNQQPVGAYFQVPPQQQGQQPQPVGAWIPTQNVTYSTNFGPNQQQPINFQPGFYVPPSAGQPPPMAQPTRGLDALHGTDRIVIKQKKEMLEVFMNWETNNRYEIYNSLGQLIYYAFEDSSALSRCFFGENRPFCIRVIDLMGQSEVMVVNSSVDCCTRDVTVEVPPGRVMSHLRQEFAFFTPSFYVNDATGGGLVFKIKSPMTAAFGSFGNVNFDILSGSDQNTVVGQITKQWGGFFKEWLTDADTFGLTVPRDMDPTWKAVLLGATFVVDFEFYEKH